MSRLCWICLAGAAGTATRYLVAIWAAQRFGSSFPVGTLIVNLTGCFIMAVLMQTAISLAWSPTLRSALTIGYLGGLTTYSSFNYETTRMFQDGASGLALVNAGATIIGGLVAGWLGLVLARELVGH